MTNPSIETRCRFSRDGVDACDEVTSRLDAIRNARQLGLSTAGMERQIDLHLKGLDLRDRDDAK